MKWQQDKGWADSYLSEIEAIITHVAGKMISLRIASPRQDREQATDYVAIVSEGEIACRLRRSTQWRDFTLRLSRPSGAPTEVEKILSGWGRWYLYGWTSGRHIDEWIFVDLDLVRRNHHIIEGATRMRNHDGSSDFVAIPIHRLAAIEALLYHEWGLPREAPRA